MLSRTETRAAFAVSLMAVAALIGCRSGHSPQQAGWGPESPELLETYLTIREKLVPTYEQAQDEVTRWALRELGTMGMFTGVLRVALMRKQLQDLIDEAGIEFADYQRLTRLVYGRWLRAVRDEPSQEVRVVRLLRESYIGLDRQLRLNPPRDPERLAGVTDLRDAVAHHLRSIKPFALDTPEDKQAVLSRIDANTRAWLEQHRERIEAADFGIFDTAPPPRDEPAPAPGSQPSG
ncbi:MAG: hypothetical protein JSV80_04580 [Acidobacteriota bacterium]|nr:MAG: hypothetical protein JSV80_04580 [Acidobacteriota bacterium]